MASGVLEKLTPKSESHQKWHEQPLDSILWNNREIDSLYDKLVKSKEISSDICIAQSSYDEFEVFASGEPTVESIQENLRQIIVDSRSSKMTDTVFSSLVRKKIILFARSLFGTYNYKQKAASTRKKVVNKKKKKDEISPIVKMGIKTGLSLLFNLIKRSTLIQGASGLCEDIFMNAHEMIFEFPPLTLYDSSGDNQLSDECLAKVNLFLSQCSDPSSSFTQNEKYLALILQLDLAYQRGSLSSILEAVISFISYPDTKALLLREYYKPLVSLLKTTLEDQYKPKEGEESTYVPDSYLTQLTEDALNSEQFAVQKLGILLLGYIKEFSKAHTPSGANASTQANISGPARVFLAGGNSYNQLLDISGSPARECAPIGDKLPKSVLAGSDITMLLTEENTLLSVGKGDYGRLGTGNSNSVSSLTPVLIQTPIQFFSISQNSYGHGLAFDESGDLWSWGDGDYGKLGHGNSDHCHSPKVIQALQGKVIVSISCGWKHSAAVTDDGELYTWGLGDYGRLGLGDTNSRNTPSLVAGIENVSKVYCADSHTLCLTKDGKVYAFGDNGYGKLGIPGDSRAVPTLVDDLVDKNIVHISLGEYHSMALSADGSVYTWGYNVNGHGVEKGTPTFLTDSATFIAAGYRQSYVITTAGNVLACGESSSGESGFNETKVELTSIPELEGQGITHISTGASHTVFSTCPSGLSTNKSLVRAVSHAPYCIDLSKTSFTSLQRSLSLFEGSNIETLSENDKQYYIIAVLVLLRVNLYHASATRTDPEELGLDTKSSLLNFYRETLLYQLQHGTGEIQNISKTIFEDSWSLLLPSIEERLKMLDSLLPASKDDTENLGTANFLADLLIITLVKNQDYAKSLGLTPSETDEENFTEENISALLKTVERLLLVIEHHSLSKLEAAVESDTKSSYVSLIIYLQRHFLAKMISLKAPLSDTVLSYINLTFPVFESILKKFDEKADESNFGTLSTILSQTSLHTLIGSVVLSLIFMKDTKLQKTVIPSLKQLAKIFQSLNRKNPPVKLLEKSEFIDSPAISESCWVMDTQRTLNLVLGIFCRQIILGSTPVPAEVENKDWFENTLFTHGLTTLGDSVNDKFLLELLEENAASDILFSRLQSFAIERWIMVPRVDVELPPIKSFIRHYFTALIKHHGVIGITKKYVEDENNPEIPKSLLPLFEIVYSTREKVYNKFTQRFPEIQDSDEEEPELITKQIAALEVITAPLIERALFLIKVVAPSINKEESSRKSLFDIVSAVKKSPGSFLRQSTPINPNVEEAGKSSLTKSVATASEFQSILWKPMSTVISTLRRLRWLRTESPNQVKDLKAKIEGFLLSDSINIENLALALRTRQDRAAQRVEGLKELVALTSDPDSLDSSKIQAIRGGFDLTFYGKTLDNYSADVQGVSRDIISQIEDAAHELYAHITTLLNSEVESYEKITGGDQETYTVAIILNLLNALTIQLNPSDVSSLVNSKIIAALLPLLRDAPTTEAEKILFPAAKALLRSILTTYGVKSSELPGTALTAIQGLLLELVSNYINNKNEELSSLLDYLRRICVNNHIKSCLSSPEWVESLLSIVKNSSLKESIMAIRLLAVVLPSIDFNNEGNARFESIYSEIMNILAHSLKVKQDENNITDSDTTEKTEILSFEFDTTTNIKCTVPNKTQITQNLNASEEEAGYCLGKETFSVGTYKWKVFASDERESGKFAFFGVAKSGLDGTLNILESSDIWIYRMDNGFTYHGGKHLELSPTVPNLNFLEFTYNADNKSLYLTVDEVPVHDGPIFTDIDAESLVPIVGFVGGEERINVNILDFSKTSKIVSAFEPRVPLNQSIIAQEIVELLRSLHKKEWWSRLINQSIVSSFRDLNPALKELEGAPENTPVYTRVLSTLKIISGVDEGIRIGGQAVDTVNGLGTIHELKLGTDQVKVYFPEDAKMRWIKLSDINPSNPEKFDVSKLFLNVPDVREINFTLQPISSEQPLDAQNLFCASLKVFSLLLTHQAHRISFTQCDSGELFSNLLIIATRCIPLKQLFCITELERASISLTSLLNNSDGQIDDEFINEKFILNKDFDDSVNNEDNSLEEWMKALKDESTFKAVRFASEDPEELVVDGLLDNKQSRKLYTAFMNDLFLRCKDKRKALLLINQSLQILYARKAVVLYLASKDCPLEQIVTKNTPLLLRLIKLVTSKRVMQLTSDDVSAFIKHLIASPLISDSLTAQAVTGLLNAAKVKSSPESGSDFDAVSTPPVDSSQFLLEVLLGSRPITNANDSQKLINTLSAAILSSNLNGTQKNWAVKLLLRTILKATKEKVAILDILSSDFSQILVEKLPLILSSQYKSEKPTVTSGNKLLYSQFLQFLSAIAIFAEIPESKGGNKDWEWLSKFATVLATINSVNNRTQFPIEFVKSTFKNVPEDLTFSDNSKYTTEMDKDLLEWKSTKPDDWKQPIDTWVFGKAEDGQLSELSGSVLVPTIAPEGFGKGIPIDIVLGERCSFILTEDGNVFASGLGDYGRLGLSSNEARRSFEQVGISNVKILRASRGSYGHCLALDTNGALWSWGDGDFGKLGHNDRSQQPAPKIIQYLVDRGVEIKDFWPGYKHSLAYSTEGALYTWGMGDYGRLGHGDSQYYEIPKEVEGLAGQQVNYATAGSGHTIVLVNDGTKVYTFGDGDNGKLGHGDTSSQYTPKHLEAADAFGPFIKAEAGEEFSALLSEDGKVYTFGTGNNGVLGHDSTDSCQTPTLVQALAEIKIVDICAGGYHLLALAENGDVYSWGYNDYGQLGQNSTSAIQVPTKIDYLSGKGVARISCGSQHTCVWTEFKDDNKLLPEKLPDKYLSLKDAYNVNLVYRLKLLSNISNQVFSVLSLLPIQPGNEKLSFGFAKLKNMLKNEEKVRVLRKNLSATMTAGDYGPTLQINRWLAEKNKNKSVFYQVATQLAEYSNDGKNLRYEKRVYKVEFYGEGAIDAGGPYNESISQMAIELMTDRTPIMEKTANGKAKVGYNQDCIVPTSRTSPQDMIMYKFLGRLLGFSIRTKSPLGIKIAFPVWKKLLGLPITIADLKEIDENFVKSHECLLKVEEDGITEDTFEYLPLEMFPPIYHNGATLELSFATRVQYVNTAFLLKSKQWDKQIEQIKIGFGEIIPIQILSLFTPQEVEILVCGSTEFNWDLLKQCTKYSGDFSSESPTIQLLWEVLRTLTPEESELFLRFVWGKTRLPNSVSDFERSFEIQSLSRGNDAFPTSATCFFKLNLPIYTTKEALETKLRYAITNTTRIDSDNNAGSIEDYEEVDVFN